MKRIGAIVCLAALIVTMTASVCFGVQSLKLVESYPEDGQKSTSIENMGVKLTFNSDIGDEKSAKANAKCFSITDDKGHKLPIRVFYDPKNSKKMMVLADAVKIAANKDLRIKDNVKYTLHISGDLTDNEGNTLGADQEISFTTLNQSQNTKVYMIMMVIMFGGMFFFTSRQAKKQMAKQDAENGVKEEPFNPYKEAKKTGKSVEEVMAAHEKEMARKAAKAAKKAKAQSDDEDDDYEDDNGNYKVKKPRPISAGGSNYVTGRKALAEARIAEEERLAKRRAANSKKKKKK
ncbi:Ig-like domain-containing protein [Ihubacter sp. rT4E-8]|uniref:Ig-like domain-containing protein n=1 Tax=Ihubacter sp. rT4E-8 TaxID=3242369 RepID=UPI003CE6B37C